LKAPREGKKFADGFGQSIVGFGRPDPNRPFDYTAFGPALGAPSGARIDRVTNTAEGVRDANGNPARFWLSLSFEDRDGRRAGPIELQPNETATGTLQGLLAEGRWTAHAYNISATLLEPHFNIELSWSYEEQPPVPDWEVLDDNAASVAIAAGGNNLYQLWSNGSTWKYVGPPMTGWQQIGDNINTVAIAAGGDSLYELHNNGHIWRYDGTWKQLDNNPATKQIIAADDNLFQLWSSGNIFKYVGPPMTGWKQLDNNPATKQIIAAGDDLYQIRDNGYILKYTR